jgi:hypothetical protein
VALRADISQHDAGLIRLELELEIIRDFNYRRGANSSHYPAGEFESNFGVGGMVPARVIGRFGAFWGVLGTRRAMFVPFLVPTPFPLNPLFYLYISLWEQGNIDIYPII